MFKSFFKKLDFFEDPLRIYSCFRQTGAPSVLLESARLDPKIGRYSIVAKNPFLVLKSKGDSVSLFSQGETETLNADPWHLIQRILRLYASESLEGAPPYLGGAIGYFSYEAKNSLEPRLSQTAHDDLLLPDIYLLFFDEGILLDHKKRELYVFFHGPSGKNAGLDSARVERKLKALSEDLKKCLEKDLSFQTKPFLNRKPERFETSLDAPGFMEKVQKAKAYIRRGDIFQANLSQRFSFSVGESPLTMYESLRRVNPSSFFGFLDAGDFQILSGSPERLVKLERGILETRPIAGTRARGRNLEEDSALSMDLILNEKERAEHIMLVDLERNDLGRVSEYGSVSVDELMVLENYSHVKHIVSNVRGVLRKDKTALDVLKAVFPGGTITGTPKIRCMEVIDELEPVARGPYTGSLGYLSFTGNMDFNILIRSLVLKNNKAYLQVGAGIVADSVPEKEYEETLCKAEGILTALFGTEETHSLFRECRASHKRA